MSVIFQHKKNNREVGRDFLLMGLFSPLIVFFMFKVIFQGKLDYFFIEVFSLSLLLSLFFLFLSYFNFKKNSVFIFKITDKAVISQYPKKNNDWSFKIYIKDIDKLKIIQTSNNDINLKYYSIILKNGKEYKITINYGNPRDKIFEVIRNINPNISIVVTTD